MTDCLIVQPIAAEGVALLRHAGLVVHEAASTDLAVLLPHLATARAVITRNHGFPAKAIAAAPMLRVIAVHGTGTDRVDRAAAGERGIAVVNTPGSNAQSVAEHALALMFASARAIPAAEAALRRGDWEFRDRGQPMELAGKTLGLVGLGRVAKALVPMAQGIGLAVTAVSEHATAQELSALRVQRMRSLTDLLGRSDVVSLHGVPSGAPILDAARIAAMKPGAILINTARGALVDNSALASALHAGRLGGAALDVFAEEPLARDSPLLRAPNVILTPHIGGMTQEARVRTALAVARAVLVGLGLPEPQPSPE